MVSDELLKILCCPETHQPLRWAEAGLIQGINSRIAAGQARDRAGRPVATVLEGGLVREDSKYLYPVRNGIPVLLIDEAIPL